MNIYNTLTHKIEKFVPNEPGKVSMRSEEHTSELQSPS